MDSKLCCVLSPRRKCHACGQQWCVKCWGCGRGKHRFDIMTSNRVCPITGQLIRTVVPVNAFTVIEMVKA